MREQQVGLLKGKQLQAIGGPERRRKREREAEQRGLRQKV